MFQITNLVVRSLVAASLLFGAQVFAAAAQLEPLTIGYSNFTGIYGPLWIAVEERIGTKYGLDLKRSMPAERVRSSCSPPAKCPSFLPQGPVR